MLKEQSNNLELYSRKNNIIIRGIKDSNQETQQQCETAVRDFFKIKLNIPEAKVEAMPFVRCHRLKARWRVTSRDVIVRFRDFGDRETIWSRKSELNGDRNCGINEDFPRDIAYNRRKLYPIFHRARKSRMSASLKGDKLVLDGTSYTVKTLGDLEGDLHPKCFSERSDGLALAFGGILSEWHTFSNWARVEVVHDGITFPTLEHAYMYTKAVTFGDTNTAKSIMTAPDAQTAKSLSYSIKGVNKERWDGMKQGVMRGLLGIKFASGSEAAIELLATGEKRLAETGRDPFYACGMSITDRNVLDTSKWMGNVLGKLLGEIRHALRE